MALLKSLANPKRLCILWCLYEGEKTVSEIHKALSCEFKLSQSSLSQHLARMRADEIVICRRQSRNMYYSLRAETTGRLLECLHQISEDPVPQTIIRDIQDPAMPGDDIRHAA